MCVNRFVLLQVSRFLTSEVGVLFTIFAIFAAFFLQSKVDMDSIKDSIRSLENQMVKQRAQDREEMVKQRNQG